jgi:D-sedoheptulose 7-phosphate isomerase
MADLRSTHKAARTKAEYAKGYLDYLATLTAKLDTAVIERVITAIEDAGRRGKAIYFIGNGGSASTASHFANDIGFGTRAPGHAPFKAISLVDNVSVVTALANDDGYESIFTSQLESVLQEGDVLVALSVSGNSPNVLGAVRYAKGRGAVTVGFTGFDGGELRRLADINLHVPTPKGEYGPVEDVFMILDHLIGSYLRIRRRGEL